MNGNSEKFVNNGLMDTPRLASIGPEVGAEHVAILLALLNGAETLAEQVASFGTQVHANWSLIVSDDGSTDSGPDMVRSLAARRPGNVTLVKGPGRGFAQNFLRLIACAGPNVPFAALSDQDDVWLPDKLQRAVGHLQTVPSGCPGLYAGRTIICDAALRPLRGSPRFELPPDFRNALVQSIGGGNTMVLNRAALDLVQETARHARGIVAHDWWIYQIVTGAGGRVIYDPVPQVLYRQHAGNIIGANDTAWASASRIAQVLTGRFRRWNTANWDALEAATHWLTPQARKTLQDLRQVRRRTAADRIRALRASGVYRQTRRGNAALLVAAALNRL